MKNILKVVFVIIGTVIGAGFASRKRDISFFCGIWKIWNNRNDSSGWVNWIFGL